MQDYIESLGHNDAMTAEWRYLKTTQYKFDPNYNYYTDLFLFESQENKKSQNPIPDSEFAGFLQERIFGIKHFPKLEQVKRNEFCGRVTYTGQCPSCLKWQPGGTFGGGWCTNVACGIPYTSSEMKERVWKEWLSHKYKHFKNNWKPKTDDGLNYMWLTINFAPDVTILDAQLHAAAIFNLKILSRAKITYCYEYNTKEGQHIHIHALVELKHTGTVGFSALKDDVLKAKNRQGKMNLYLKMSWAKKYTDRCDSRAYYIAYLNGHKTEEKLECVDKDKIWRKENNLEELYIKDNN